MIHPLTPQLTYIQSIIMGLAQGISELFPISSLGHSVILPKLLGWSSIIAAQGEHHSYFLSFLVALHVATALALVVFYRKDWIKIVLAVLQSIPMRNLDNPDAKFGWLLIVATLPAGLVGLSFESILRTIFAKPLYASIFLFVNGLILLVGERSIQRSREIALTYDRGIPQFNPPEPTLTSLGFKDALTVGFAQAFALLAGISRSGITMVAGLIKGLDHDKSARFSFMLATPIILAAGVYKLPSLFGSSSTGIKPQILLGSVCAFAAAYASVRFLTKYFHTRTLFPFAVYCLTVGSLLTIKFL